MTYYYSVWEHDPYGTYHTKRVSGLKSNQMARKAAITLYDREDFYGIDIRRSNKPHNKGVVIGYVLKSYPDNVVSYFDAKTNTKYPLNKDGSFKKKGVC